MHSRAMRCVLHGPPRDLVSRTATSLSRTTTHRTLSTSPALRSTDDNGNKKTDPAPNPTEAKPKNPRERSQAAAEAIGSLTGQFAPTGQSIASAYRSNNETVRTAAGTQNDGRSTVQPSDHVMRRLNLSDQGPGRDASKAPIRRIGLNDQTIVNVRSLPRASIEAAKSATAGVAKPPAARLVQAPTFFRGRGRGGSLPIRPIHRIGEGGAQGQRPSFPGPGVSSPSTSRTGGRGGFGGGRGGFGGGRGGRDGRNGRNDRGRGERKKKERKEYELEGTEEERLIGTQDQKDYLHEQEMGEPSVYTPQTTAESLHGWRPAVPSANGTSGMVESAVRAMRVLAGGQAFNPTVPNHPRDTELKYHAEKPVFFADPSERDWLVEMTQLKKVHGPGSETKEAVSNVVVHGKYDAPKFADFEDTMAIMANFHNKNATYKASDAQRFADKVASLLPANKPANQVKA